MSASSNAVVRVTEAISASAGASPSGPYLVTLTFNNTGNTAASALATTDAIPAGFTYVAGSARWSVSGSTALTDAAAGDPSGISYDYGITQAGAQTATIASLAAGHCPILAFAASIQINSEAVRVTQRGSSQWKILKIID